MQAKTPKWREQQLAEEEEEEAEEDTAATTVTTTGGRSGGECVGKAVQQQGSERLWRTHASGSINWHERDPVEAPDRAPGAGGALDAARQYDIVT